MIDHPEIVKVPCWLYVARDRLVTLRSNRKQSHILTDPSSEHEANKRLSQDIAS